jgi:hypothetical protein
LDFDFGADPKLSLAKLQEKNLIKLDDGAIPAAFAQDGAKLRRQREEEEKQRRENEEKEVKKVGLGFLPQNMEKRQKAKGKVHHIVNKIIQSFKMQLFCLFSIKKFTF